MCFSRCDLRSGCCFEATGERLPKVGAGIGAGVAQNPRCSGSSTRASDCRRFVAGVIRWHERGLQAVRRRDLDITRNLVKTDTFDVELVITAKYRTIAGYDTKARGIDNSRACHGGSGIQPTRNHLATMDDYILEARERKPARKRNLDPLPLLIRLLLHLGTERNSTHDPIPELLINHTLVRIPIVLHNLIQPVNQRLTRRHFERAAAVREVHQLRLAQLGFGDVEDLGEVHEVLLRGGRVAVEHGGRGDFFAAEGLGDGFEGEVLGFFGGEEDAAVGGEEGSFNGILRRKFAVGLIADLDAIKGAERDAIRREEVRDEAIVGGTYGRCCVVQWWCVLIDKQLGNLDKRGEVEGLEAIEAAGGVVVSQWQAAG
ncbi:1932_t:CDS:2, partial [Scutellospora calospora]